MLEIVRLPDLHPRLPLPQSAGLPSAPVVLVAGSDSLEGLHGAFEWALAKMAKPGGWAARAAPPSFSRLGMLGSGSTAWLCCRPRKALGPAAAAARIEYCQASWWREPLVSIPP